MPHTTSKSDTQEPPARSAQAQKADEVQMANSARAGAGHAPVVEGGQAEAPTEGKGKPKPATSRAHADSAPEAGTSSATAGKAEKQAAAENAALTKTQDGRGHRKAH